MAMKFPRYIMFGALYFAQGSIMGYFAALNAVYFLQSGLQMTQAGLIGTIAMIPFVLKIFLGMLSDKVSLLRKGHRRPYVIIGLLVQSLCLLLYTQISPVANFALYAVFALVLMTGMALYDTCTDGYALDSTPEKEEGAVQGIMVGGRAAGTVIVGGLGFIAQTMGWSAVFLALALVTLLPLPMVLWAMRENERPVERRFQWEAFGALKKRSVIGMALLGAVYSFCIYGAYEIVAPALKVLHNVEVGPASLVISAWGLGVIAGGVLGSLFSKKVGLRNSVVLAVILSLVSILLLAFFLNPTIAWVVVPLFGIAFGYYETLYFAVAMRQSDPRIAASMFAILMAIANIGTGIGLGLTGVMVDGFGYTATFIVLALANLLAFPLIRLTFGKNRKASAVSMA